MTNPPRKSFNKTQLSHQEFYNLCLWIKEPGRLDAPTTQPILARDAAAALGFPVSQASIKPALEAVGLTYIPMAAPRLPAATPVLVEGEAWSILVAAVCALYASSGTPLPPAMHRLVGHTAPVE
jgi:hypothetical protein